MFTFLGAELLLYYAYLMIKSGSAAGRAPTSSWGGWVRISEYMIWWHIVLLWLSARHSVYGSCAMPHALPCSAVYIRYVFNNDNVRKLHQYCELFQVCMCSVSVCIPCAPGFWHCFRRIFFQYFSEPGLLLSNQYCGGERGRKKIGWNLLGTSIFATHEHFCHYILNWMWFIPVLQCIYNIQIILKFSLFVLERKWMEELLNLYQYSTFWLEIWTSGICKAGLTFLDDLTPNVMLPFFFFFFPCSFIAWLFYGMTISGLLYLKIKKPELPRSYKVK